MAKAAGKRLLPAGYRTTRLPLTLRAPSGQSPYTDILHVRWSTDAYVVGSARFRMIDLFALFDAVDSDALEA